MNTCARFLKTIVCVILASMSSFAVASDRKLAYQPLSMQGNEYASSCSPKEKKELKDELGKARIRSPESAWSLIDLILCSPLTDSSKKKMRQSVLRKIKMKVEGTGQDQTFEMVDVDSDLIGQLFARGEAWRAKLRISDGAIKLQYFANEACVESRVLDYSKGRWKLSEYGQACD